MFDRFDGKIINDSEINDSGKIIFYKRNGEIFKIEELNIKNIKHINGMMTRIYLKNGEIIEGFGNLKENDENNVYLWIWDNLNEDTGELIGNDKFAQTFKKILVEDIGKVESIMYSNPRWGGRLTNKFSFI